MTLSHTAKAHNSTILNLPTCCKKKAPWCLVPHIPSGQGPEEAPVCGAVGLSGLPRRSAHVTVTST